MHVSRHNRSSNYKSLLWPVNRSSPLHHQLGTCLPKLASHLQSIRHVHATLVCTFLLSLRQFMYAEEAHLSFFSSLCWSAFHLGKHHTSTHNPNCLSYPCFNQDLPVHMKRMLIMSCIWLLALSSLNRDGTWVVRKGANFFHT